MLAHDEGRHVLQHGDLDGFTDTCLFSAIQGKADALRCDQACDMIAHYHWYENRFAVGPLKGSGDPRQALDDGVVGGLVVIAATLSKGDDATRQIKNGAVQLMKGTVCRGRTGT